ncbi:MAG TPA: DNA alkylation repair protein [Spirochaetota bacterium]|mgnify:CR=1 FL=1|nr:DNA alkylation repair protein [Spirochaetota bacterium]HPI22808.1 DNA alkylation repair protein [Spirochaetota bacterium]HPU87915.1 DNA alkylation repair protein [Spirochaetota bacterium]
MDANTTLTRLRSLADPANRAGMARFGIDTERALGIKIPELRRLAKEIGTDHDLARALWDTGVHEARILAGLIADPSRATLPLLDRWARDFNSWDLCDLVCANFIDRTRVAWTLPARWARREEEFVRRAAFALIAALAVHDTAAPDERFVRLFPLIKRYATDERNFVKKAVNWALRQIGKRNARLRKRAIALAREIRAIDSRSARWIAADALRELNTRKK